MKIKKLDYLRILLANHGFLAPLEHDSDFSLYVEKREWWVTARTGPGWCVALPSQKTKNHPNKILIYYWDTNDNIPHMPQIYIPIPETWDEINAAIVAMKLEYGL